jgi:hypothetical protein
MSGPLKEETGLDAQPPLEQVKTPFPPLARGLPPPPAACADFVKRKAAGRVSCADAASSLGALDKAFTETDPAKRDAQLAALESCAGLPPGLARALRAELAPIACADALVEPILKAPPPGMTGAIQPVLFALGIAGRVARVGGSPPKLDPPFDRKRVLEFVKGPMLSWLSEQAKAIEELEKLGVSLRHYARGIVAVEAGVGELRLVEAVREVPVPEEFSRDEELKNVYYATLDQTLDPRKDRGRDAVLIGLRELSAAGVLKDSRIDRARTLLSRLYGGRRIDALDALFLPPLAPVVPSSETERLAALLPTYYAGLILDPKEATQPSMLRMLLERGIPTPHRAVLKSQSLSPAVRSLYLRARIDLGRTYFRAVDFDEAAALGAGWPKDTTRPDDVTLLFALALALRGGPEEAAAMVRKAPGPMAEMGNVRALDFLAQSAPPSAVSGMAAFNAALIRQITAPVDAGPAYWKDLAQRFDRAKGLLSDNRYKALAEDRARGAEATAKAIH